MIGLVEELSEMEYDMVNLHTHKEVNSIFMACFSGLIFMNGRSIGDGSSNIPWAGQTITTYFDMQSGKIFWSNEYGEINSCQ